MDDEDDDNDDNDRNEVSADEGNEPEVEEVEEVDVEVEVDNDVRYCIDIGNDMEIERMR